MARGAPGQPRACSGGEIAEANEIAALQRERDEAVRMLKHAQECVAEYRERRDSALGLLASHIDANKALEAQLSEARGIIDKLLDSTAGFDLDEYGRDNGLYPEIGEARAYLARTAQPEEAKP